MHTHNPANSGQSLTDAVKTIKKRLLQDGDRPYVQIEEALSLVDQLAEFEFGRFLLMNRGIDGYWTQYMVLHPKQGRLTGYNHEGKSLGALEKWLLDTCPTLLATQERFQHFQAITQGLLKSSMSLASVPCGLMDDLLTLNFSGTEGVRLFGIDLDANSLDAARLNARRKGLEKISTFVRADAWNLDTYERFDLITSNGLNIYEADDSKVELLYSEFFKALKNGGHIITSFLTPPPGFSKEPSPWILSQLNPEDLKKQKVIFSDIIGAKWQSFRTLEQTTAQLEKVGFSKVQVVYDRNRIFPTICALKDTNR